jgi:spore photoproduct lyase
MFPEQVYYEPAALSYELGKQLREKYADVPWIPIESHNSVESLQARPNSDFPSMKRLLIVGIRKTHRYVPNQKSSDFLVPFTSSGCSAMCLYCYLVCNYNKCSYLRLFVNREQMLERLMRTAMKPGRELTFEIGSNSDLVLENTITGNLEWTIEKFAEQERGFLTFPTKFDQVQPLLSLNHRGRTILRMSVNPQEIISHVEFGTSPLKDRIRALNAVCDAGYRVGLLIAPVILLENWKRLYTELLEILAAELSPKVRREMFIEVIFMTYSFVHRAINTEAFPNAVPLYDPEKMTGRGRGKYCYRQSVRQEAESFLREEIERRFGPDKILYIV